MKIILGSNENEITLSNVKAVEVSSWGKFHRVALLGLLNMRRPSPSTNWGARQRRGAAQTERESQAEAGSRVVGTVNHYYSWLRRVYADAFKAKHIADLPARSRCAKRSFDAAFPDLPQRELKRHMMDEVGDKIARNGRIRETSAETTEGAMRKLKPIFRRGKISGLPMASRVGIDELNLSLKAVERQERRERGHMLPSYGPDAYGSESSDDHESDDDEDDGVLSSSTAASSSEDDDGESNVQPQHYHSLDRLIGKLHIADTVHISAPHGPRWMVQGVPELNKQFETALRLFLSSLPRADDASNEDSYSDECEADHVAPLDQLPEIHDPVPLEAHSTRTVVSCLTLNAPNWQSAAHMAGEHLCQRHFAAAKGRQTHSHHR